MGSYQKEPCCLELQEQGKSCANPHRRESSSELYKLNQSTCGERTGIARKISGKFADMLDSYLDESPCFMRAVRSPKYFPSLATIPEENECSEEDTLSSELRLELLERAMAGRAGQAGGTSAVHSSVTTRNRSEVGDAGVDAHA
ncbi:hypothetical protein FVE85_6235 [Porphyridium purpureum]|uniref:Uncharacterized protein n=1 Tax=Porphyridium purpureum TaxID=35688 RepID=A0A5J4Z5Y2_PORPP|nr:hypothetical protein FVE85_6235 [Porphyridium purpureum]|eukprot:POR8808..scf295_1